MADTRDEPRQQTVRPMTPDEIRQAEAASAAAVMAEVEKRKATETVPGGRYKDGERFINAEGEDIKKG